MQNLVADRRAPQAGLWLLLAGLAVGMFLVLPNLSHYHGDEAFYTNAAIRMTQTGDYWTPYFADGRPRFLKPILSYWAITASYQLFGISVFSSRLPFALAGCLVVYLTYRLALVLFGRRESAWLAALIAASNLQLWTLSLRATPDILVILFVTLSWLGMARILFQNDQSFSAYLCFYGGAGLAVQTKGLLGLFPVAFCLVFQAFFGGPQKSWRRLFNLPALLIGLTLATFWYGVVASRHGSSIFNQFFSDQLTAKVSYNPWGRVQNLASYVWAGLRHALPWTLIVTALALIHRGFLKDFFRKYRRETIFLLGSLLALAVCFCFSNMKRTRYVAVGYPMLAVWLAPALLAGLNQEMARNRLALVLKWAAGMTVVSVVLAAFTIAKIDVRCGLGVGLIAVVAGALFVQARTTLRSHWAAALAALMVTAFVVNDYFLRAAFSPSPIPQLTSRLLAADVPGLRVYALQPAGTFPDQLRLYSAGRLNVQVVKAVEASLDGPLLLTPQQRSLDWTHWTVEEIAAGRSKWASKDWRKFFSGANPRAMLDEAREKFYLAWPPAAPTHAGLRDLPRD